MKLDRYILRELTVPFLIGTVAVVLMFQANALIALFKTFSMTSVPPLALAKLLFYKTPYFLNMTLPVGTALATSLAMSRFVRESELTAMRAAGASIKRVIIPVAFFGVLVGIGNFYLSERIMPAAEKEAANLSTKLAILGSAPDVKANVFIAIRDYSANIGTVYRQSDGSLLLNDVFLMERQREYEMLFYMADQGTYKDGVWSFPQARVWHFVGDDCDYFKPKKDLTLNQRIDVGDVFTQNQPTEMSLEQLRDAIREGRAQKTDTTVLEVTYHTRYSVPAACFVFAVVGPIFAIFFGRSGSLVGVLLSILMVLLYYNVYVISTDILGNKAWLNPILAAWLPNILFLAGAFLGLRRLE